ncbi:MAG: acyl-CoA dehydrogenase [Gammaproteobacteria bacterium]|nr:acyl-CoA dehydrogenase [Gammaproteobacteria bacterium]|tara:strand:+ start:2223 stop:3416 length:1194 start_codon:yes stop_codon:yes gene_type:complete
MSDLETFRADTRAWLEENCPSGVRQPDAPPAAVWGGRRAEFYNDDAKVWLERMAEKGWTVPTWPTEYGGGGLSNDEAKVLREEMQRIRANPPLFSFGISMLGPALLEFANEEQKKEHLTRIARGEIRWCQGYSEPGAGSDLASLRTRAVREGDHYVVNGSKIWTSDANHSDWIFCLVRTDPDVPKHNGISFLLIDMETPGVSVSPIQLISGASPFCETFFDDVRVPAANLVGVENDGWNIAKRLLQHERAMLGEGARSSAMGPRRKTLLEVARETLDAPEGRLPDAVIRDEMVQLEMDQACYKSTFQRSADAAKAGRGPGPETSMFKLYLSEMGQRGSDLRQRIVGAEGLGWSGAEFDAEEVQIAREWLYGRASSILGGTSEVQMNIIAKRVLGLPD